MLPILRFSLFFFNGFLDIFEVPRPVLEASWRSSRHLGPLGGLLERLERILGALGAWKLLERSWNHLGPKCLMDVHGPAWNAHGTCIGSAVAGGLSEGGGSIPKGISLPWSGASDAKLG